MSDQADSKPKRERVPQIGAADGLKQLHIVIPVDLDEAIDTHLEEMRGMQPDQRVSRSDAARALLRRGIVIETKRKADRARER